MKTILYPFILMSVLFLGGTPAKADNMQYCFHGEVVTKEMLAEEKKEAFAPVGEELLPGTEPFDLMMKTVEGLAGPKPDDLTVSSIVLYKGITPEYENTYFVALFQETCLINFFKIDLKGASQ